MAARVIGSTPKVVEIQGKPHFHAANILVIGMAFCSPSDCFSKKRGRTLALDRMHNDPLIVPFLGGWREVLDNVIYGLAAHRHQDVKSYARLYPSWLKDDSPYWGPRWMDAQGLELRFLPKSLSHLPRGRKRRFLPVTAMEHIGDIAAREVAEIAFGKVAPQVIAALEGIRDKILSGKPFKAMAMRGGEMKDVTDLVRALIKEREGMAPPGETPPDPLRRRNVVIMGP